jgi:hypothetical protein
LIKAPGLILYIRIIKKKYYKNYRKVFDKSSGSDLYKKIILKKTYHKNYKVANPKVGGRVIFSPQQRFHLSLDSLPCTAPPTLRYLSSANLTKTGPDFVVK